MGFPLLLFCSTCLCLFPGSKPLQHPPTLFPAGTHNQETGSSCRGQINPAIQDYCTRSRIYMAECEDVCMESQDEGSGSQQTAVSMDDGQLQEPSLRDEGASSQEVSPDASSQPPAIEQVANTKAEDKVAPLEQGGETDSQSEMEVEGTQPQDPGEAQGGGEPLEEEELREKTPPSEEQSRDITSPTTETTGTATQGSKRERKEGKEEEEEGEKEEEEEGEKEEEEDGKEEEAEKEEGKEKEGEGEKEEGEGEGGKEEGEGEGEKEEGKEGEGEGGKEREDKKEEEVGGEKLTTDGASKLETNKEPKVKKKGTPVEAKTGSAKPKPAVKEKARPRTFDFPTTLGGFGYGFNDKGQLRHTETGDPFVFAVREGDQQYNQARYEALGEMITEVVYGLLETELHLKKVMLPMKPKKNEPLSFFFASEDASTNREKLLVLIHGSGVVRAGQWSRRLIINDCLDSGTQFPFIRKAMEEGYGVVVMNANRNVEIVSGKAVSIRGNSSPEEHAVYVWKHFVKKSKAARIDIVAHSYGGVVTTVLATECFDDFKKRVNKIAFTDSVHDMALQRTPRGTKSWMIEHAVNWVSSPDPLDTPQHSFRGGVRQLSAGTKKHEETSWFSFSSIFKFFAETP